MNFPQLFLHNRPRGTIEGQTLSGTDTSVADGWFGPRGRGAPAGGGSNPRFARGMPGGDEVEKAGKTQSCPLLSSAAVGAAGFEPATSRSQSERAARLRHAPLEASVGGASAGSFARWPTSPTSPASGAGAAAGRRLRDGDRRGAPLRRQRHRLEGRALVRGSRRSS